LRAAILVFLLAAQLNNKLCGDDADRPYGALILSLLLQCKVLDEVTKAL
jgi:hypothetical protein